MAKKIISTFNPTSWKDIVIGDKDSYLHLADILKGKVSFPSFDMNGICLYGVNGTGKTTLARLLPTLIENAGILPQSSSARIIMKSEYYEFTPCAYGNNTTTIQAVIARCKTLFPVTAAPSGFRYEIFDEVDVLTVNAQASLKALMSQTTNSVFIYTTNNLNQIDKGIRDRSVLIEMMKPSNDAFLPLGRRILSAMRVSKKKVADETLLAIADKSDGSFRQFGTSVQLLAAQLKKK